VCSSDLHDILVYDCVDLDWAYSSVALRRKALKHWHKYLLRRADIVFFSMKSQFDEAQKARSGCYFVPNACSLVHFDISAPCPPALQAIPGPRIGFIGAMLKKRFAAKIIKAAAARRPQWSFVLIGEADKNIEHLLRSLPNIHLPGRFPHSEMPAFVAHFDICLIANVFDDELSFGFPKKLYEYLASGKPIVATPMPEVRPFAPLIKLAGASDELVAKIEECLTENADPERSARLRAERQALARRNTWPERVEKIVAILNSELHARGYSSPSETSNYRHDQPCHHHSKL